MIKCYRRNYNCIGDYNRRFVMLTDDVPIHDDSSNSVMAGYSHVSCYEWIDVFNKDDDMSKTWIEMSMYNPLHY